MTSTCAALGRVARCRTDDIGNDHDADQTRIAADPETQRWWTLTDPCQESLAEHGSGHWWAPMQEVWHLDAPRSS